MHTIYLLVMIRPRGKQNVGVEIDVYDEFVEILGPAGKRILIVV